MVKQVTVNGYSIKETAGRLGVYYESLKSWIKKYEFSEAVAKNKLADATNSEIKRLHKELKRVRGERDILKKAVAYFANNPS